MADISLKGLSYDSMGRSASVQFSQFDQERGIMVSLAFDHERAEGSTGEQVDEGIRAEARRILLGCLEALGPSGD